MARGTRLGRIMAGIAARALLSNETTPVTGATVTLSGLAATASVGAISASVTLALDTIGTSPTAAYSSARKLLSAYSGNLIRVRRSSDNTEQDIGVTSDGYLDQSELTTFVGANSGFVVTLYDQGGSGRNLTIATTARQPRIINSGTLNTLNGYPAIEFISANSHRLESSVAMSSLITASAHTYLIGMRATSGGYSGITANIPAVISDAPSGKMNLQIFDDGSTKRFRAATNDGNYDLATVNVTYPRTAVVGVRRESGSLKIVADGGTEGTVTAGNMSDLTGTLQLGAQFSDGAHFAGHVCELVFYNSSLTTSDYNKIGEKMATITGTSWSTVT